MAPLPGILKKGRDPGHCIDLIPEELIMIPDCRKGEAAPCYSRLTQPDATLSGPLPGIEMMAADAQRGALGRCPTMKNCMAPPLRVFNDLGTPPKAGDVGFPLGLSSQRGLRGEPPFRAPAGACLIWPEPWKDISAAVFWVIG